MAGFEHYKQFTLLTLLQGVGAGAVIDADPDRLSVLVGLRFNNTGFSTTS